MDYLYQADLAHIQAVAFGTIASGAGPEIVRRLRSAAIPIRRVVDVGCGAGPLTQLLVEADFEVTGIDSSGELLDKLRPGERVLVHGGAGAVGVFVPQSGALDRSWSVLKPGGRMVTIAAAGEAATGERVKESFFIVEPNETEFAEIGRLLESGKIRPVVDAVVPFEQASSAYAGKITDRGGYGKVVLAIRA